MKKLLNIANLSFGITFIVLQLFIFVNFHNNGGIDYPMEKEMYIKLSGNSFDYYFGYTLFTCLDTGIYSRYHDKFVRLVTAGIPIILISLLWLAGVTLPEEKTESENNKEIVYKKKIFIIITTVTSLYYLYYSFVYIINFFMKDL